MNFTSPIFSSIFFQSLNTESVQSYIKSGRVFDGGNLADYTIPDQSPEGNTAYLYTGRYVDLSTSEYVQFNDPTPFTTTPAKVSIYARSGTATNVPINWGGTAVGATLVANDLWQKVEIDLTAISEATRLDPSVIEIGYDGSDDFLGDLAWAEIKDASDNVLDTIPLNQQVGTYTDGDPCYSKGDRIGTYEGTPVGGEEEGIDADVRAIVGHDDKMWFDGIDDHISGISFSLSSSQTFYIQFSMLANATASVDLLGHSGTNDLRFRLPSPSSAGEFWVNGNVAVSATVSDADTRGIVDVKLGYDGAAIYIEYDGVRIATNTTTYPSFSGTLDIGRRQITTDGYFNGLIHGFVINKSGSDVLTWDGTIANGNEIGTVNGSPVTVGQKRTTIPQLAGMDFNKYQLFDGLEDSTNVATPSVSYTDDFTLSLDFVMFSDISGVLFASASTLDDTIYLSSTQIRVRINGTFYDLSHDSTLLVGVPYSILIRRVSGVVSYDIDGVTQSATASSASGTLTVSLIGIASYPSAFSSSTFHGLLWNVNINNTRHYTGLGDDPWKDTIGSSDGTEVGTFTRYLVPESSTAGVDANGNAITNPRVNDAVNNLDAGGYAKLPAIGDVRSLTFAYYHDGTDKTIVNGGVSPDYIDVSSGNIDCLNTATFYVDGVATQTLQTGWNIVGMTFAADSSEISESEFIATFGNLLAYEPSKALTADEQLKNYNAFKTKYGL